MNDSKKIEEGIEMWLVRTKDGYYHGDQNEMMAEVTLETGDVNCGEGRFFLLSQLQSRDEEMMRRGFEAAREQTPMTGYNGARWYAQWDKFEDFLKTQKRLATLDELVKDGEAMGDYELTQRTRGEVK